MIDVKTENADAKTLNADEQLSLTSQRTFPAAPFPCKYVHSVVDTLQDAAQAVLALQAAGCDTRDIHLMASWDFVAAVEGGYQQQGRLSQTFLQIFSLIDEGFEEVYLHEARRGHHILVVRPSRHEQIIQVRDLLASHHAHLVKYVDSWTVANLLS